MIWLPSKPAGVRFSKSEVTVGQYRVCVRSGACARESFHDATHTASCNWGHPDRWRHPMNCVTWHGAVAFCKWAGGRLPTRKEWQAEASNNGARKVPWGSGAASCAHAVMDDGVTRGAITGETDGCGRGSSWPVCSRPAGDSVSGLCDMIGNVWEWTSTPEGNKRVACGGGWGEDVSGLPFTSAASYADPVDARFVLNGFRCAQESPSSKPKPPKKVPAAFLKM